MSEKPTYEEVVAAYDQLVAEKERLRLAIMWALGEQPDSAGKWFSEDRNDRAPGQGRRYWWRSHLRTLAGLGAGPAHASSAQERT